MTNNAVMTYVAGAADCVLQDRVASRLTQRNRYLQADRFTDASPFSVGEGECRPTKYNLASTCT